MVSSRKSRILALSAVLLTIVFIFITTHNQQSQSRLSTEGSGSSQVTHHQMVETTTKIGAIDESIIKMNEDKIKQKIQDSKDDKLNADSKGAIFQKAKVSSKQSSPDSASTNSDDDDELFDAAQEFQSIISLSPVVIFSKTYCGFSQALKNLLKSEYEINPAPIIMELDKHKNGRKLQDYIAGLSGRKTVPNIFVGGISRGGSDELKKLHEDGALLKSLNTWGDKSIKVTKINAPSNS